MHHHTCVARMSMHVHAHAPPLPSLMGACSRLMPSRMCVSPACTCTTLRSVRVRTHSLHGLRVQPAAALTYAWAPMHEHAPLNSPDPWSLLPSVSHDFIYGSACLGTKLLSTTTWRKPGSALSMMEGAASKAAPNTSHGQACIPPSSSHTCAFLTGMCHP